MKADGEVYENEAVVTLFKKVSGNESLDVKFEALADTSIPALLTISEEERRFADMMKIYGAAAGMMPPGGQKLILNSENSLVKTLGENAGTPFAEAAAKQILSLATLAQRQLSADELRDFLSESYKTLEKALENNA